VPAVPLAPADPSLTQTAAAASSSDHEVAVRQARVVFSGGQRPDVRLVGLHERAITVGRATDAGLCLPDSECSRIHAELRPVAGEPEAWEVVDRGSRNGLFVDGRRTEGARLEHGTVIRLGRSLLVVTWQSVRASQRLQAEGFGLHGPSVALQLVRAEIAAVAPHPMPVLVTGPTGVGKELVARAIHEHGGRAGRLVALNCAGVPAALAESELFGHVAGAFTGAAKAKPGLVTAAAGGTLFLDEVGEMPLELQAKLLRVLAEQRVRPVGAVESEPVDVRVVAATNVDLQAAIADGRFRGDLYARLSGWPIAIPALAERRDDVLAIAVEHLRRSGSSLSLTADAAEALVLHAWPGNVRELEQALAVAAVRAQGAAALGLEHLPVELGAPILARSTGHSPAPARPPLALAVPRDGTPSAADLARVLEHFAGNVAEVARFFGKDRRQIYRWAQRHGLVLRRDTEP
jgi:transcriptional regulator with GAF, ATPase, and Fis domain